MVLRILTDVQIRFDNVLRHLLWYLQHVERTEGFGMTDTRETEAETGIWQWDLDREYSERCAEKARLCKELASLRAARARVMGTSGKIGGA